MSDSQIDVFEKKRNSKLHAIEINLDGDGFKQLLRTALPRFTPVTDHVAQDIMDKLSVRDSLLDITYGVHHAEGITITIKLDKLESK